CGETVFGDLGDYRPYPPPWIGAPGGGIGLGRGHERPKSQVYGLTPAQALTEPESKDGAGMQATGAARGVIELLVTTAGHVVLEQTPGTSLAIPPGEERHHRQALHGSRKMIADHLAELIGLALE